MLNESHFDLVVLELLVPLFQYINCIPQVHPNIAYAHGNASHEYIRPVLLLVPHADYPRYDAQEMENLVPIAYSNASISPFLNIHRVLEDKCTPVVGGQFR